MPIFLHIDSVESTLTEVKISIARFEGPGRPHAHSTTSVTPAE